jgi:hypothetical protein
MGTPAYKSPFSLHMLTRRRIALCLLFVLAGAGCSRDKKDPAAAAALAEGVTAFPAETRMLVGVGFPKIAGSSVGKQALDWALAADPAQKEALLQLLEQCKIDPGKDLDTALIGMGEGREQVAMLVRGKLDESTVVACTRKALAGRGGSIEVRTIHGHPVWAARDPQAGTTTWFTIETGRGALLATSDDWMARALDPNAAKLPSRPELNALVNRVDPAGPLWMAALMRPEVGQRMIDLTNGAVKAPATSFTLEARFDAGVDLLWRVDMQSEADAVVLVEFARSQQPWLTMAAIRYGLNKIVGKMAFAADGRVVKIGIHLDDAEVAQLADGLGKLAVN